MELWQLFGYLHPKLVQFPLVLLLAGLVFDLVGLVRRSERFHWAAKILSAAGTVFLLFAFICGIYAEIWAARAGVPQDSIEWHEFLANVSSWGFVILTAWRLFIEPEHRKALTTYTVIGLTYYSLLVLTAYLGGSLVFNYGAAVAGARANTALSLHDLNNLATRQTDLNLKYSERMHHIFGWLTLALSGSLLASALFPKKGDKIRWVGPMLLLLGGVFLFFCADLDLYRFTDLRQLRDREVQLHKALAIVLVVIGVAGLRKRKQPSGSLQPQPDRFDSSPIGTKLFTGNASQQSKVIAVLALIGGGLLFTHVHTVAPYANVAAGVYIAHVCMGIVALSIGASRLLQDGLPRYRRAFALSFAVFMCIESVLLITYNEGLPWYIGYGKYNRWGPHQGTVAPYGPIRAELTFNNDSRALDVYVLDRFKDTPVGVTAPDVNVIISRGYEDMAFLLQHVNGSQTSPGHWSHYQGIAPALKNVAGFCARLPLPVGSHTSVGYFDPWVTPKINAIPPNELARYQCPMHEGVQSEKPGACPLCGMSMIPIDRNIRLTLHDPGYDMLLSAVPQPAATSGLQNAVDVHAIDPTTLLLTFTPEYHHRMLSDLAVMHEHLMHLIVVSDDLKFFGHIHPVRGDDGRFRIRYKFPRPGRFLLFSDIMPRGTRNQVFRLPVMVAQPGDADQEPPHPAELEPSVVLAKPLDDDPTITAELIPQPRTISAGLHTDLLFRLSKGGQPLTDLEPYLGAMGHCVIISEDTKSYLHCHPEQVFTPKPDTRGGPVVSFHTVFPRPGRYKIWGQLQRNGHILIADFVVDVRSPLLPPKVINFILDD